MTADEIEVRPEVMEMLQAIYDGGFPGVRLKDTAMLPNLTEMAEYPSFELRYSELNNSWYIIDREKV